MTEFEKKRFSVSVGQSAEYRDNWEAIFAPRQIMVDGFAPNGKEPNNRAIELPSFGACPESAVPSDKEEKMPAVVTDKDEEKTPAVVTAIIQEIAREVLSGKSRSYVKDARILAQYILDHKA
jgi:hypothetical protein